MSVATKKADEPEPKAGAPKMPDWLKDKMVRVQGGREYMPVAPRIRWFREDHPTWTIMTAVEHANWEQGFVVVLATVTEPEGGRVMSMAHKVGYRSKFGDFVEKAETGAVGRALAFLGYGSDADDELDEGLETQQASNPPATNGRQQKPAAKPEPPAKPEPAPQSKANPDPITPKTLRHIYAVGRKKGWDHERLKKQIKTSKKLDHLTDLTEAQGVAFYGWLDANLPDVAEDQQPKPSPQELALGETQTAKNAQLL